jgi:hypothetical protein
MRRGGGSEREVRNELLACFFVCLKSYVGQPHPPLLRQPISGFLDVVMLQNPPRLSILTRRADGGERGIRNRLLALFLSSVLKIFCVTTFRWVVGQ